MELMQNILFSMDTGSQLKSLNRFFREGTGRLLIENKLRSSCRFKKKNSVLAEEKLVSEFSGLSF